MNFEILDQQSSYSIVLNLLGFEQKNIGIRVNANQREIAITAKKDAQFMKHGFYWVFGVPTTASLKSISTS